MVALANGADRVIVTRNGVPAALMLGWSEWEGLLETIDIMRTPGAVEDIKRGERDVEAGEYATIDDLIADLQSRSEVASEE